MAFGVSPDRVALSSIVTAIRLWRCGVTSASGSNICGHVYVVMDENKEDMVRSRPAAPAKRFESGGRRQMGLELGFCESLSVTYRTYETYESRKLHRSHRSQKRPGRKFEALSLCIFHCSSFIVHLPFVIV